MESEDLLLNIDYSIEEDYKDILDYIFDSDFENVKRKIYRNENIYEVFNLFSTPLTIAIRSKRSKIANLLLDIHECDLEVLKDTKYTKTLVAFPEDQTPELLNTIEATSSDSSIPVILKKSHGVKPQLFFLRSKLKSKNDSSLKLIKKLEKKNKYCNLNWSCEEFGRGPALHEAIKAKMNNVVERLVKIPTVDVNIIFQQYSSLQVAVFHNNKKAIELLTDIFPDALLEDKSFLDLSVKSRDVKMIEMIVQEMIKTGKISPKEIARLQLRNEIVGDCQLFHLIARYGHYEYYLTTKLPFDEDDFYVQDHNGETILHILVRDWNVKPKRKMKIVSSLMKKYPKLLMIKDVKGYLPIHTALMNNNQQDLIEMIHEETVKMSGNKDYFNEDVNISVMSIKEGATSFEHFPTNIEAVLEKLLNGKLKTILEMHGVEILHRYIQLVWTLSSYIKAGTFILGQTLVKFDLSEEHNGMNAYIRAISTGNCGLFMLEKLNDCQAIIDYNMCDEEGKTIFMYLCENNATDWIKRIIKPEYVQQKTSNGSSCLHFIFFRFDFDMRIFDLLIENGVDAQAVNDLGLKPIALSLIHNNMVLFERLLEMEPDEKINDHYGMELKTLLHFVTSSFNSVIGIEKLLMRNPDFSATDYEGNTPLHSRAITSGVNYVKCLMYITRPENLIHFDVNLQNDYGDTILFIMIECLVTNDVDFFLQHFCDKIDFNLKNKKNQSIVHKFAMSYHFSLHAALFNKYPKLFKAFDEQMGLEDCDGKAPLSYLLSRPGPNYDVILKYVTLENVKKYLPLFISNIDWLENIFMKYPDIFSDEISQEMLTESIVKMESQEVFDFILSQNLIKSEKLTKIRVDSKNFLHLIFEKNNSEIIDSGVKFLSDEEIITLMAETDNEGRKPFELLNDENKNVFECLKLQP